MRRREGKWEKGKGLVVLMFIGGMGWDIYEGKGDMVVFVCLLLL